MCVASLARFAKIAYRDAQEQRWLEDVQKDGWTRVDGLCSGGLHIDTFVNGRTREGVIAFRGTADAEDLVQDALLAAGQDEVSFRLAETLEFVERRILPNLRRLGGSNIHIQLVGHSLGGTLALYVSDHTGLPGEVFNAYCTPIMQQRSIALDGAEGPDADGRHGYSNITLHIVQEDHPVGSSGLAMVGVPAVVYSQSEGSFKDRHTLVNFLGTGYQLQPTPGDAFHAFRSGLRSVAHMGLLEVAGVAAQYNPQVAAVRRMVQAAASQTQNAGRILADSLVLLAGAALKKAL